MQPIEDHKSDDRNAIVTLIAAMALTLLAGYGLGRITAPSWHIVIHDNHGRQTIWRDLSDPDMIIQFFESPPQEGVMHFGESQVESISINHEIGIGGGIDHNRIEVFTRPVEEFCEIQKLRGGR